MPRSVYHRANACRLALFASVGLALAACNPPAQISATVIAPRPVIDARLKTLCLDPVAGTDKALDRATVIRLWNRDRATLRQCATRHAGLVKSVDLIEAWALQFDDPGGALADAGVAAGVVKP